MSSTQFTALIRLPFSRGSFVDPPQAQWDAEKDRQLWKVISKSSKTSDLNWVELASKFQVPPTFLLQQAAWLYERHFEHVRNQMKKVSGSTVTAAASGGGSTLTPVGAVAMQRTGSAHRSQLFKRPPRFQQKRPRELAPFAEGDGTQEGDEAESQGNTMLPFASAARPSSGTARQGIPEHNPRLAGRQRGSTAAKQSSPHSQVTTETASSMTSSASASDAPSGPQAAAKSPVSPNFNHRAAMANLGSPRAQALRRKEGTPALTLHYTLGSNSLDTVAIAASIYGLLTHPGRACIEPDTAEVVPYSDAFFTAFWSAAASLLDYFADFYTIDTPLMQSVWFHLLDIWQTASPAALYKQDSDFRYSFEAQTFNSDYNETLALFQRLVGHPQGETAWRGRADGKHTEALIHNPNGRVEAEAGAYETGPFLSGLKPWQQFLFAGAPGFLPTPPSSDPGAQTTQDQHTRYIPQPAIALMQAHTARARALLTQLAHRQNLHADLPQSLAAFDAAALAFPSVTHRPYTAHSLLVRDHAGPGTVYAYSLLQGVPPVRRHEGLSDPSMIVEHPDLMRLDEAVGSCRGAEAYVPMTGPRGEEGVGFDVWAVREERGVCGVGEESGVLGAEDTWGEMFDEWYFEE
ncbi:hypothetical protein N0V86_000861 [Didymella sp. IMI 355093]|nr:hypothetical protein N0V86_000861 [Didymella sp. IMI 355093]